MRELNSEKVAKKIIVHVIQESGRRGKGIVVDFMLEKREGSADESSDILGSNG
jgi:hypothetical protein